MSKRVRAKKIIEKTDSFMLFSYSDDTGAHFLADFKTNADHYALVNFIKMFLKHQENKEIEAGENYFNDMYEDKNTRDDVNYYG